MRNRYVVNLNSVNLSNVAEVGGKNASLGEMIQSLLKYGIKVPEGYATTTKAYEDFLVENKLEKKIPKILSIIKNNDIPSLRKASKKIQSLILAGKFSDQFKQEITQAYASLQNSPIAVRSSATTEDTESASFAGQQETFLNVKGLKNVMRAIKMVFASLFNPCAINYRGERGFDLFRTAISASLQRMIRSDRGISGVMFTLDTESGFNKIILISASYGLGEAIVQGQVIPDEFCVFKPLLESNQFSILERRLGDKAIKTVYNSRGKNPRRMVKQVKVSKKDRLQYCLSDNEIQNLAQQALIIEKHYGKHMDIEWAKDGISGEIYIVQARNETVQSQRQTEHIIECYQLTEQSRVITQGQSIGNRIGKGLARIILDPKKMHVLEEGEILVTDMTDPDWEPVMKRAAAIITNRGGRTCHAAIISRELGIPAIVGCGDATTKIKNREPVTVSCAGGQIGQVFSGLLPIEVKRTAINNLPKLPLKLCINLGNPEKAFDCQKLPNEGVGLARLEFIISQMIGIHPNALLNFDDLPKSLQQRINKKIAAYTSPKEFYVEKLREGISLIAAAFHPKSVIFRFSDFKSNEYANLLGGHLYEPVEENPMIGYRGASRYKDDHFRASFELECKAFLRVREKMGLTNTHVMVPFVRTVEELCEVLDIMAENGLKRGSNHEDLKIYMMCEIPSNALLADEFLEHVDGFSIGSNDLTQLTLGLDRDSSLVASLFDERDKSIKMLLHKAIRACIKQGKYIGICGQGPSDYPDFAEWLMDEGIQNISLNPDSIVETWLTLADKLQKK